MASNNPDGSDRVSQEESPLVNENVRDVDDTMNGEAPATVTGAVKDESIQGLLSSDPVDVEEKATSSVDDPADQLSGLGFHPHDTGDIEEEAAQEIEDTTEEELISEIPSPSPANSQDTAPKVLDPVGTESIPEPPSPDPINIEEEKTAPNGDDPVNEDSTPEQSPDDPTDIEEEITAPKGDDPINEDSTPEQSPPDPTDIEEGKDSYHPGGFHPVYIGDIYADRYKILNKIGYGAYSTVWLVQDLKA